MSTYIYRRPASPASRLTALSVAFAFTVPTLVGCGSSPPPPTEAPRNSPLPRPGGVQQNTGMSTRNKVILLAGAAALYYMWKKKQNAQGQPVQYYRSESTGRIYYRDPRTKQAIWVSPPPQGIQVPANEAQEYSNYQGYNNQRSGEPFGGWNNGVLAPAR